MEETSQIDQIKQKSAHSVIFLTIRNFGIQAISMLGFFILSVLLGASEVGLFSIVAETVSIFGYFSDIGLASALIQKKTDITQKDLRSSFTVQQILVLLSLVVIAVAYPSIAQQRNFGTTETWILVSLCFSFFAASLKTIPSVLLERKLNFKSISLVDITENAVFYIAAVLFAFQGYGALSYAIAAFLRSIVGLVMIYRLSPWDIGFSIDPLSLKQLFRFGIPFQLNSFIAVAKDRLSSLLVAGIIGTYGFGLISWAQKATRIPLSFMDAIMKVTFPTYARLQDNPDHLLRSIQKSTFFVALFTFPMLAGICLIAPEIVYLVPKYTKWLPAILPMYLLCFNAAIASVTTPLTNAFNAVGKIYITTKLMLMWTVLTWIFYPLLSYYFGYLGTAIATLLVGLSSFVVWFIAFKQFNFNILNTIKHPFFGTLIFLLAAITLSLLNLNLYLSLFTKISISILLYSFYLYLFSKSEIYWLIANLPWQKAKKS